MNNPEFFFSLLKTFSSPNPKVVLKALWIETKVGPMIAIADEEALYLLEFAERKRLEKMLQKLNKTVGAEITQGENKVLLLIEKELRLYFQNQLKEFITPLYVSGSSFQRKVWEELKQIPYGTTCSYLDLAKKIGMPKAFRAVANANGSNKIAIVIPCHRVINTNSGIGGYGGGVEKKKCLLDLERFGPKK